MTIIKEISEECGPGSSPDVEIFIYTTNELAADFVSQWNKLHADMCQKTNNKNEYQYKDWIYKLEIEQKQADIPFSEILYSKTGKDCQ